MVPIALSAISTDTLQTDLLEQKQISAAVLRLDKIHPLVSGNKWFKLKYYIREAQAQKKENIITFGGAYSNHIIATAAACKMAGLTSTGIIRGEEPAILSPTLLMVKNLGMQLVFVSRDNYTKKAIPTSLQANDNYLIHEGGYGPLGAKGAGTIMDHFPKNGFTHICCAVGTGTMLAGLVNASTAGQLVTGISVLKNNFELESVVRSLLTEREKEFTLNHHYHFGGYAKWKPELLQFMNEFYRQTRIPTDFVYTGKLFFGITDLIKKDHFPAGSKLIIIHSGGLQGNVSLDKNELIF